MTGMEASLASGLLKTAGDRLVPLIASQYAAITGVKKDLSKLQGIHREITGWLSTVRDLSTETDLVSGWVTQVKDVSYDIDDLLYDVYLEAEKHKIDNYLDKHAAAECFCTKPKLFLFRCKVAQRIKAIKVTLDTIAKERSKMNAIIGHLFQPNHPILRQNRVIGELSLLTNVEESQIPTRDQEKVSIINKILYSNEDEDGWIVSVVGIGGSGKTTLAKHICHDSKIRHQFKDKIYWVHVSQEFDVNKLLGKLFEAITKKKSDHNVPQHTVDEISRNLTGDKFLLVLDDAWHQIKEDWSNFMVNLRTRAAGSRLMITTRDLKVAEVMKSGHIFQLAYLSEAESWSLCLKSSGSREEDLGSEFIQYGKDIVKKCGGVPLAIITLGGILSEKREITTWKIISQSCSWNQEDIKDRVFASLKLSYIHLKDHLKQCFVFCSIFPKGYRINRNYLIEQWIAHGFVKQMMEEPPEVIGSEYFDSLVKAGFLKDLRESWPRNQVSYKMHDLIHDLITQYILWGEIMTSLPKNLTKDGTQKCRYLSLTSFNEKNERAFFDKVRALYVTEGNPLLDNLVTKSLYICSVVLDFKVYAPSPLFIWKLKNLGYLEIHCVSCTELPEAISSCWNLQSLHFIDCSGFVTLPKSIAKLKKLRTLGLLRTDLKDLPRSVGECQNLQSLRVSGCRDFRELPNTIPKNENLKVLQIIECTNFKELPSEVTGEFSNIQTISLAGCPSVKELPSTFSSRTLRTLDLSQTGITKLPEWVTLIGTLECINLEECWNLVELPKGIANLTRLEFLSLKGCRSLHRMPSGFAHLTRLKRLDLFLVGCGEDDARISELENLDMINGDMQIMNLHHLMDSSDAEQACLKRKKNMKNLTLSWSTELSLDNLFTDIMEEEFVSGISVLDAFEPPSKLEKLTVDGYRGDHLPCWMSRHNDSSYLECAVLKQSSQFRSLINLELSRLHSLKHMRGILVFPSLKTLRLNYLCDLEELWTTTSGLETGMEEVCEQYCFPALSHLKIIDCPKMTVGPYFPPLLESLELQGCNGQLIFSGCSFTRLLCPNVDEPSTCSRAVSAVPDLKNLSLVGMTGSASDWGFLQHLIRLESLQFGLCDELTELPQSMQGLTSLRKLCIGYCPALAALPEWLGKLRSLQYMRVPGCPVVDSLPRSIGHLTSLRLLEIERWDSLKQLPEEIQHLTSLEKLKLESCKTLTVLPERIGQLSALKFLSINFCPAFQSLPSSIQHLTALQRLTMKDCRPELARRYKKEVGDDWHLVSHIPWVNISQH